MQIESYDCKLCLPAEGRENKASFLRCAFAKNCWLHLGVAVPWWLRPDRAVRRIKRVLHVPFVMEIIILVLEHLDTKKLLDLHK
jgi:hypothetical protein